MSMIPPSRTNQKWVFDNDSSICVTSTVMSNGILVGGCINLNGICLGDGGVGLSGRLALPSQQIMGRISVTFSQKLTVPQDEFPLTLVAT